MMFHNHIYSWDVFEFAVLITSGVGFSPSLQLESFLCDLGREGRPCESSFYILHTLIDAYACIHSRLAANLVIPLDRAFLRQKICIEVTRKTGLLVLLSLVRWIQSYTVEQ